MVVGRSWCGLNDASLEKAALADDNTTSATSPDETFVYRCIDLRTNERFAFCPYDHIFTYSTWPDSTIGIVLLIASVGSLIGCLIGIVKLMQSVLGGQIGILLRKLMDKDLPYPFGFLTNYVVMFVGCVIVMIIQSSGVFRATLTPLVGIGVVTLDRLYPLLLGANIGTTFTGVIAALSADPAKIRE